MTMLDWAMSVFETNKEFPYIIRPGEKERITKEGYDGIVYTHNREEEIIAFESNQVKSADPVTYSKKGKVNPPSKRFNLESDLVAALSPEGEQTKVPWIEVKKGAYRPLGKVFSAGGRWSRELFDLLKTKNQKISAALTKVQFIEKDLQKNIKRNFLDKKLDAPTEVINTALGNTGNPISKDKIKEIEELSRKESKNFKASGNDVISAKLKSINQQLRQDFSTRLKGEGAILKSKLSDDKKAIQEKALRLIREENENLKKAVVEKVRVLPKEQRKEAYAKLKSDSDNRKAEIRKNAFDERKQLAKATKSEYRKITKAVTSEVNKQRKAFEKQIDEERQTLEEQTQKFFKEHKNNLIQQEKSARLNVFKRQQKDALLSLPPDLQKTVTEMRDAIDGLSKELIKDGDIADNLKLTIDQNLGTYLHRSYKIFDGDEWAEFIVSDAPEAVKIRNRAEVLFTQYARAQRAVKYAAEQKELFNQISKTEAMAHVRDLDVSEQAAFMLRDYIQVADGNVIDIMRGKVPGQSNKGILKVRGDKRSMGTIRRPWS